MSGRGGVSRLQEAALTQLEAHLASRASQKTRFPRLLLLLSPLSSLPPTTVEDLFFSGIMGNIKIPAVIPYILQLDQSSGSPPSTASPPPSQSALVPSSPPSQASLVPSPPPSPPNQAD